MIVISVAEQRLYHRRRSGVWRRYPVSTAARGTGCARGSFRTPPGRHRVCAMIGAGLPLNTVFRGRRPVGLFRPGVDDPTRDWILGRILWLAGLEPGHNRRGRVDTKRRYIYIHGTHDESNLGRPASKGCIRMSTRDVDELFEHARVGERVYIR